MNDHIIKEFENYMRNPLNYAILLEGPWGCGKTYFVQKMLTEIETVYISLNGISSLNSVSFQLLYQLLDSGLLRKKIKKYKVSKENRIACTASSLLASYIGSKINFSFSELVELLGNIDIKGKLIIFDDLERCNLSIEEILGFVNTLVEHNKIKILLVANEAELKENKNYLKIKEKLIYQTFKYVPDLGELYHQLILDSSEEIINNKHFFIEELKRKNHCNIRTIQFVFQRYKELKIVLDKIISQLNCTKEIKTQIYNDIFKYLIVISRDYKLGEEINNFKGEGQLAHYQLINNTYFCITSFRFINDFIQGIMIDEIAIRGTLENYANEIKSSTTNENGSLHILNRWLEAEDDEIEENTNVILTALKKNSYSFDLYPKILIYLIRITNAGFSENFLNNAVQFMETNIEKCAKYVSFGYNILDADLSKNEQEQYETLKNKITDKIEEHNESVSKNGIHRVKSKEKGKLGEYIYSWSSEHHSEFLTKKKFLSEIGIDNIMYIVENGNAYDVRLLIYMFNKTYNYSNVKELYPSDKKDLIILNNKLENCSIKKYSKMKLLAFTSLKKDMKKFIAQLE